jgi:hypothetical protein
MAATTTARLERIWYSPRGLWGFLTGHPAGRATLHLVLVALLALLLLTALSVVLDGTYWQGRNISYSKWRHV